MRQFYALLSLRSVGEAQIGYFLEEIVSVGIILVLNREVECLSENSDDIRAVRCRHEVEGHAEILHEFVLALGSAFIDVDFICNDHAWDVGAVVSHLVIPALQVLVSNLATRVEDEDSSMSAEVVGRMEFIERFLPCSVPNV